jgi:hypothetical protein
MSNRDAGMAALAAISMAAEEECQSLAMESTLPDPCGPLKCFGIRYHRAYIKGGAKIDHETPAEWRFVAVQKVTTTLQFH